MSEPASSESGQDFDVFSVMDWKDGIGTLPGSDLKVNGRKLYLKPVKCLQFIDTVLDADTHVDPAPTQDKR